LAEPPVREFRTRAAWAKWLQAHHGDEGGVWLKIAKKGTGVTTVTYDEALEVALCYGWIDGQAKPIDDAHYLQRFTPRRARSRWSKINRDRATALIERGEMQPAGLREIERAKADGRWDAAYDGARTATVPDDLQAALDADPRASEFFATLSSANRYAILYRVQDAKRPETRARRIEKYVAMCREHRTIH
jgi:uncharacterized protein YdeI (YjbR/CyaY-like superfamily)